METQAVGGWSPGAQVVTCPLCEHVQAAGAECEVCGRGLVEAEGTAVAVETLPGLEPTVLDTGGAAFSAPERLPELETTAFAWGAPPAAERMEDLEGTLAAPVEVVDDHTPDIEATRLTPVDDAVELLALGVTCRYCQAEALPGEVLCGRCGVRLPVPLAPERAGERAAPCGCGAQVRGSLCPQCGARRA